MDFIIGSFTKVYYYNGSSWVSKGTAYDTEYTISEITPTNKIVYCVQLDIPANQYLDSVSFDAYYRKDAQKVFQFEVTLHAYDGRTDTGFLSRRILYASTTAERTTVSFGNLGHYKITGKKTLYIRAVPGHSLEQVNGYIKAVSVSGVSVFPDLSLSVSPLQPVAGDTLTFDIGNRAAQTVYLSLSANGKSLVSNLKTTTDSKAVASKLAWFDTAGESGNTLTVSATVTDSNDRTAAISFELDRPQPLDVTIEAPTASTLDGAKSIAFAWITDGYYGVQTKATLQYSYDNANWSTLTTVTGTTEKYTAPAGTFRAGTVYWRIRAYSSYGLWSAWRSARFTLAYNPVTVALTSPTSGTFEGGAVIKFAWTLTKGSGTITGTQMQTSVDDGVTWTTRVNDTVATLKYNAAAKLFPPGNVKWRVRAKDSYAGWSEWKQGGFKVSYAATSYVVQLNSPTGGNINAAINQTFGATLKATGTPYTPFTMQAATLHWRSRTTDAYNDVDMALSGANASVTIAGGTFPTGTVYWYIEATDNTGSTTTTPVYTISTLASDMDAQPVAPINTVEISNDNITFVWRFASTSGEAQNGADLEYSTDGTIWTSFAHAEGTTTSIVTPPDTFYAGNVYWRVRAYNRDDEPGPWSTVAQFVAYGAPAAPSVSVDAVPFATVRWQGLGQTSFEVDVDGVIYGPFLGTDKAYELYDYLDDGIHTARVRILGDAALWSLWGETTFEIENVPQYNLVLRGSTDVDTELNWAGGESNYYVYRDRKMIGLTNLQQFHDRVALGTHEYHVIERLQDGNYNPSNLLTRTMEVDCMHIADVSGGDWVAILHTLKSANDPEYSVNSIAEFSHQDNSEFPVVSVGPYIDENASYSAVFLFNEQEEHRRFRALFRKPVILKTTDGVVMIGFLDAWERMLRTSRDRQYYTAYTFRIQRIDWEDFIDDTT